MKLQLLSLGLFSLACNLMGFGGGKGMSVSAGSQNEIKITASGSVIPGTINVSLNATSGSLSPNTSGVFSLGVMDNGDDRIFPSGVTCGSAGVPCLYTTIPVWQIDESAKTATLTFDQKLPTNLYSSFGGNVDQLANGNVEYDLCNVQGGSDVFEVTNEGAPQTVWNMRVTGTNVYRGFRIPSLYPGVQW